ncbi:uncharacterized protein LOC131663275 [Phymastichus coffea]|uniref:uncharacterized protein LOC131663275 n=1 Tax=Phymastichus coffea TaxID=108790 RepID=UPI00273CC57B|nr:uncharacterized protein LOC131663275 [Phymastichus coffea]
MASLNAFSTNAFVIECPILLATAQVIVAGPPGREVRARALLDQGSEATFISESLVLGLQKDRVQMSLTGVGGCEAGIARSATNFFIKFQLDQDFKLNVNAFVFSRLTTDLPPKDLVEFNLNVLCCVINDDLSEVIQRIWTIEEVPNATKPLKPSNEACETLFVETHTRVTNGQFQVRLPVIGKSPLVGIETRRMALGSLRHQHQRLAHDPKLAAAYTDFMKTYLKLGHMEPIPRAEVNKSRSWYLPHHAVLSKTPVHSKIRFVFDASRKTQENQCLNDFLIAGDIVKMFRQIRIVPEDQDFQRIVWFPSPSVPITDYRLTTISRCSV